MFTMQVRVNPRSSREGIVAKMGDLYKVSLHDAPEKGKANKRLIRILSDLFNVAVRDVEIISGQTKRNKKILIKTISEEKALSCLESIINAQT